MSNASAHRMTPDVPLVVPEVNPSHLALLDQQEAYEGGGLVTNPNCSVAGLVVALILLNVYNIFGPPPKAFMEVFGLAMASYLGLAGIAFWLDRLRPPRVESPT